MLGEDERVLSAGYGSVTVVVGFLERERVKLGVFRREKRKKKWRREKEVAGPLLGDEKNDLREGERLT